MRHRSKAHVEHARDERTLIAVWRQKMFEDISETLAKGPFAGATLRQHRSARPGRKRTRRFDPWMSSRGGERC